MNNRALLKKFITYGLMFVFGVMIPGYETYYGNLEIVIYANIITAVAFFLIIYIFLDEDSVKKEIKEKDKIISEIISEKNTEINMLEYRIEELERNKIKKK